MQDHDLADQMVTLINACFEGPRDIIGQDQGKSSLCLAQMGLFRGEIICHRRNNGKLKRIRNVPACSAEDDRTYR